MHEKMHWRSKFNNNKEIENSVFFFIMVATVTEKNRLSIQTYIWSQYENYIHDELEKELNSTMLICLISHVDNFLLF